MIIPIVDDATVIPAAKPAGYPRSFISGMSTDPIDAVSDADDPEIPPNNMLATTLTNPSPPRNRPTKIKQKLIRRFVMPPAFINCPIKINNGKAIKAYESIPAEKRCGSTTINSGRNVTK